LTRQALEQLVVEENADPDAEAVTHADEESRIEKQISLAEQRLGTVLAALRESGAKRVVDLACGEGRYLRAFLDEKSFTEILGVDVSMRALQVASSRLKLDRMPEMQRTRIKLLRGSLAYRDKRLEGFDAATVVEVIEPPRSPSSLRFRARSLRVRAAQHGRPHHTERRVQRKVRDSAGRKAPPP